MRIEDSELHNPIVDLNIPIMHSTNSPGGVLPITIASDDPGRATAQFLRELLEAVRQSGKGATR